MKRWVEFEKKVIDLLSLQGWDTTPEKLEGHKKVDGIIEKSNEFGERIRLAIECKAYSNKLNRSILSNIYADYLGVLQNKTINRLLLVTVNGLTPSAQSYCDEMPNLTHVTYTSLLNNLMSFQNYICGLIAYYETDALSEYYIEQKYRNEIDETCDTLERDILSWANNIDDRPIAVLASYGMGKTTLARRLAFLFGKQHQSDPLARIPILIDLDEISSTESLEGLLGKHFTSISVIPNYNFNIFMRLNSLSRFVVLLDGFDEMKRTMSWDTMRYNFEQLNRLVVGSDSKVILFGRPTAFLNEEEYWEALHGIRVINKTSTKIPGRPNYQEYRLLPFDKNRINQFVSKYTCVLSGANSDYANLTIDNAKINKELLKDIIQRPVQLKMLIEVLPDYKGPLEDLNTTVLFSAFIDLVIRREMKKKTRSAFSLKDRRQFTSNLAYWMWSHKLSSGFAVDDLPDDLFTEYILRDIHLDSIKRDLLSACLLDKKVTGGYFFPHRSFLEYLVAEHLAGLINRRDLKAFGIGYVSPELSQFLIIQMSHSEVDRWYRWLAKNRGLPSNSHFQLFSDACKHHNLPVTKRQINQLRDNASDSWENTQNKNYVKRSISPPSTPSKFSKKRSTKHRR